MQQKRKAMKWRYSVIAEPYIYLKTFFIDEGIIYVSVTVPSLCIEPTGYKIKEKLLEDWVTKKGMLKQTEYDMKTGKYLHTTVDWADFKELHLTMSILEKYINV